MPFSQAPLTRRALMAGGATLAAIGVPGVLRAQARSPAASPILRRSARR